MGAMNQRAVAFVDAACPTFVIKSSFCGLRLSCLAITRLLKVHILSQHMMSTLGTKAADGTFLTDIRNPSRMQVLIFHSGISHFAGRVARSVKRLTTGWSVRESNPDRGYDPDRSRRIFPAGKIHSMPFGRESKIICPMYSNN
jgi:hypothetical protein